MIRQQLAAHLQSYRVCKSGLFSFALITALDNLPTRALRPLAAILDLLYEPKFRCVICQQAVLNAADEVFERVYKRAPKVMGRLAKALHAPHYPDNPTQAVLDVLFPLNETWLEALNFRGRDVEPPHSPDTDGAADSGAADRYPIIKILLGHTRRAPPADLASRSTRSRWLAMCEAESRKRPRPAHRTATTTVEAQTTNTEHATAAQVRDRRPCESGDLVWLVTIVGAAP